MDLLLWIAVWLACVVLTALLVIGWATLCIRITPPPGVPDADAHNYFMFFYY